MFKKIILIFVLIISLLSLTSCHQNNSYEIRDEIYRC